MCITFFYVNPSPKAGLLRLVLVMNRDEVLKRATEPASVKEGILAGRDMTPGKEGGTWLGVDTMGAKVAFLTNIYTGNVDKTAKGRGNMVTKFLSGSKNVENYLSNVAKDEAVYNPFNLFVMEPDLEGGPYKGRFYCRGRANHVVVNEGPTALNLDENEGFFGVGNHPPSSPYLKTTWGIEQFKEIVKGTEKKGQLVEKLLEFMCSREKHHPDPQMKKQAGVDVPYHEAAASVFVDTHDFGTRTQTVVLIDHDYNLTFVEKNRDLTSEGPDMHWDTKEHEIKIRFELR